ncbi:MAG: heavy-metal-associated domain-containing protein [Syntrophomonadaceae bacterium]|nr:heavy-metal-associated domain-containing protein [Syntrophomonadaceae bacterium]
MHKQLKVEGMSCQHCKMSIETALNNTTGVKNAIAYHQEGKVEIYFNESQVDLTTLINIIDDLGFEVISDRE